MAVATGMLEPACHAPAQVIDLGDSMDFEQLPGAERDQLTCNVADIPTDDSNLVLKVMLLQTSTWSMRRLPSRVPNGVDWCISASHSKLLSSFTCCFALLLS